MAAPSAPTVQAQGTGNGSSRVRLDEAVAGAVSYRLFRSGDAAFSDEALLTATPAIRPEWTIDTTIAVGHPNWYRADVLGTAVAIATSSVAAATVITTSAAHGLVTGDLAIIAGHAGSTPAIDGTYTVTVLTPTTFTIPVTVTIGGTGGTATPLSPKSTAVRVNPTVDGQASEPTHALKVERSDR
jgi:hypothetical protein